MSKIKPVDKLVDNLTFLFYNINIPKLYYQVIFFKRINMTALKCVFLVWVHVIKIKNKHVHQNVKVLKSCLPQAYFTHIKNPIGKSRGNKGRGF